MIDGIIILKRIWAWVLRNHVLILLFVSLFLPLMWSMFGEKGKLKFDLIPFADFEQQLQYYAYDTSHHLIDIVKSYALFIVARKFLTDKEVKVFAALLYFSIYRTAEYWLFHHTIPYLGAVGVVIFYGTYVYSSSHGSKNRIYP